VCPAPCEIPPGDLARGYIVVRKGRRLEGTYAISLFLCDVSVAAGGHDSTIWFKVKSVPKSSYHTYQSTRRHIPKEPRKHRTATTRKNCTMLVCTTHQTCTQGALRSLFTERVQVAIKRRTLRKIIKYNTTGYRVIINNLVSLTSYVTP